MPEQQPYESAPMPGGEDGRITPLRALMAKLEELRTREGLSFEQLGKKIGYDRSDLRKMERGMKFLSPYVLGRLDAFYGTGDQLSVLHELAKGEPVKDTYNGYRRLEASAFSLHQYATTPLPGLLQTEAYATALLRTAPNWTEEQLTKQVAERLERQARLTGEHAVHYRAVLDEGCFSRVTVLDPGAWEGQLQHLERMAECWNITIQVLPFSSGLHDISCGNLTLVSQADGSSAAYQESSHSAALITDAKSVAELRLSYDALRDAALTPRGSLTYLRRKMEEHTSCTPPDRP